MKRAGIFWGLAGFGALVFLMLLAPGQNHAVNGTKAGGVRVSETAPSAYPTWSGSQPIDLEIYTASLASYGVSKSDFENQVRSWFDRQVAGIRTQTNSQITFNLSFTDDLGFGWTWNARARNQTVLASIREAFTKLDTQDEKYITEVFRDRGFEKREDGNYVHYSMMVERGKAALTPWIEAMISHGRSRRWGDKEFLDNILVFCQSIPYENPPIWDGDKYILGFLPPTFLLAQNRGDCDMKAVLFALFWETYKPGTSALVLTPDHMFAAVKGFRKTRASDTSLLIQGTEFLCVEPVGEDRIPPGQLADFSLRSVRANDFRTIYPLTN